MPLNVSGITYQSGVRKRRGDEDDHPDREPEHRNRVEQRGKFQIGGHVGGKRRDENGGDDEYPDRDRSSVRVGGFLTIGE